MWAELDVGRVGPSCRLQLLVLGPGLMKLVALLFPVDVYFHFHLGLKPCVREGNEPFLTLSQCLPSLLL